MSDQKPLFILFVNSILSTKLVNLIEIGKINAIIYCPKTILLKIKKIFTKHTKGNFKILELDLPYTSITFDLLFTSKTFWDTIDNVNTNIYIIYNPRGLSLTFQMNNKQPKPFFILPFISHPETKDSKILIKTNPVIFDELLTQGFLFYIKPIFAKRCIKYFSKAKILKIRERLQMDNNEHVERLVFTKFYMYFYHYMLELEDSPIINRLHI